MRTILLAEDDELSRDMLARRLERLGYKIIIAENGRVALESARRRRPALILMDLCMPEMDGWTAVRELRSDPNTASVPIIALSALTAQDDVMNALKAGCDAYETKPVVLPRLVVKIRSILDRH